MKKIISFLFFMPSVVFSADYQLKHEIRSVSSIFVSDSDEDYQSSETSIVYSLDGSYYISDTATLVSSFYLHLSDPDQMQDYFISPNEKESESPYIDFTEFGLRWDLDETTYKIGKWKQNYEFAERLILLNQSSLDDNTFPLKVVSVGNWLAQWQRFMDGGSLSLTVMPFHPATAQPGDDTRWGGVNNNGIITEGNTDGAPIETDTPDVSLIWEGQADRFDYLLGVSRARSQYSVMKINPEVRSSDMEYPDAVSLLGGISWPMDQTKLYVEGHYQKTLQDKDDDFLRLSTGLRFNLFEYGDYLGWHDLTWTIEYMSDHTVEEQSASGYESSSQNTRPFQDSVYSIAKIKIDESWEVNQELSYGFKNDDSMSITGFTYSFDDSSKLSVSYIDYNGEEGKSLFGSWKNNDNLSLELEKDF